MRMKRFKSAMLIVMVVIGFASFVSCNNNKENASAVTADTTAVDGEQLENKEVEEMASLINSVAECLDSIQLQEKMLYNQKEGTTDKQQVLAELRSFKDLLARKQQQINDLQAKNASQEKASKKTVANLQKMVNYLNAQLAEKSERIAQLEELVETKNVKISELLNSLNVLQVESDYLMDQNVKQDKQLNARYYCVGTKKELKEKGLLKGGFLKKTKVDNNAVDNSLFKRVDERSFKTLTINSKKPKLMTNTPADSYTLTSNGDGTSTLTITDAKKFWNVSYYLIIEL